MASVVICLMVTPKNYTRLYIKLISVYLKSNNYSKHLLFVLVVVLLYKNKDILKY